MQEPRVKIIGNYSTSLRAPLRCGQEAIGNTLMALIKIGGSRQQAIGNTLMALIKVGGSRQQALGNTLMALIKVGGSRQQAIGNTLMALIKVGGSRQQALGNTLMALIKVGGSRQQAIGNTLMALIKMGGKRQQAICSALMALFLYKLAVPIISEAYKEHISLRVTSLLPIAFCLLPFALLSAQRPTPALPQTKSILITGGTIHVGNGTVIENGDLGFKNGKITLVSNKKETLAFDTIINATGKHIYPGFILPNTLLGLTEVDAVRSTHDFTETGEMNPSVRTLIGYNTDSKIIPTIRTNGILYCQSTPRGGLISGTSSVFRLDGWNWEDAVVKTDDGIWLNWPTERFSTGWWVEPGEDEPNKKRREQLDKLTLLLQRAKVFNNENIDLSLAALKGLFDGSKNLYVNVSRAKEIKESVIFLRDLGIKKIVVCGGEESYLVADFLKENNIPVLLDRLHSLPYKTDDAYDLPYGLPKYLQDAGVIFGLTYSGDMETMGSRNLPFLAGTSVRLGLTKEQALQSITLNTAKILGVDGVCGSLEVGKAASLFISTGDALDMMTNNVEVAFIDGRMISLENHQKVLYNTYKVKYGIE